MSDEDLRALERAAAESPSDVALADRLTRARVRAGLGWHGEKLPEAECGCPLRVVPEEVAGTRGVYALDLHPAGAARGISLEFVYVLGGDRPCEGPHGSGVNFCRLCADTPDRVPVAPVYLGRFPVTKWEWNVFLSTGHAAGRQTTWVPRPETSPADAPNLPIVDVTHDDARDFCSWAGVRLPTPGEWTWAALGAPVLMDWAKHEATPEVRESGLIPRRFPWGNKAPTPETCAAADPRHAPGVPPVTIVELRAAPGLRVGDLVAAGPDGSVYRSSTPDAFGTVVERSRVVNGREFVRVAVAPRTFGGTPAPVVVLEDLDTTLARLEKYGARPGPRPVVVPARPAGASWCGAHDMVGNVAERVEGGVCGWSFRGKQARLWRSDGVGHYSAADDLGFRVALSA